ncbi:uncharacterized protein N7518_002411 [Penicillium psychrosexuale]|uniref:uncharacterized protein n=1 Tax=Penicillium psychrosexuale TaxID=1002107 RepID=UPI002545B412|nr:uncharacterized protein N7518_002411 [Penicillium psychrosexuale]KAJ5800343.1 hypothetical protein N7518_002411 [Penicillium psychrosexuale]
MYSCLWVPNANKFFLGASIGGYWLVGGEHVTLSGWFFSKRPEEYQTIGNCAETYPIVHLLRGLNATNGNVRGLALAKKALRASQYENTLSGRFRNAVTNPCKNCQFLVELHGGDLQNFCRFAGPNDPNARVNLVIDEELGFVVTNGIVPGKVYPYYGNISPFISPFIPDSMTANQKAQEV